VVLPTALESIGNNAFEGCNSLASIDLTKTLTSIGAYAFPNSSFFTSIDLSGTSITTIAANAFKSYGSLTSIDLPETIGSIGNYAFENCPLNRFIIRNATPPEIGGSYVFNNRPTPPFYVPKESVEVYKAKMEEWGWHGQVYSLDDLGP
jgi:hypothetical protein